jgi:hypothetical protein
MPNQMMDAMDSSYGNAPVSPPDKSPAAAKQSVDEVNEKQGDVLIEKSKLGPDVKTGDTCTFRVTADYGTDVALEYVASDKSATEQTGTPPDNTEAEISALDKGE